MAGKYTPLEKYLLNLPKNQGEGGEDEGKKSGRWGIWKGNWYIVIASLGELQKNWLCCHEIVRETGYPNNFSNKCLNVYQENWIPIYKSYLQIYIYIYEEENLLTNLLIVISISSVVEKLLSI